MALHSVFQYRAGSPQAMTVLRRRGYPRPRSPGYLLWPPKHPSALNSLKHTSCKCRRWEVREIELISQNWIISFPIIARSSCFASTLNWPSTCRSLPAYELCSFLRTHASTPLPRDKRAANRSQWPILRSAHAFALCFKTHCVCVRGNLT